MGEFQELNIIVKGDVDGSIEFTLSDSLEKLSTDSIKVNIIQKAVGQISESDIMFYFTSDAIVIGFQVRPSLQFRKLAETEQIDVRLYSVIYKQLKRLNLQWKECCLLILKNKLFVILRLEIPLKYLRLEPLQDVWF